MCTSCFNIQLTLAFCIDGLCMIRIANNDYSLNRVNRLTFVMVKCGVLFEVRTEVFCYLKESQLKNLSLSEGRAGIAWIPSNKMFFHPDLKRLLLTPDGFSLLLFFYYPSWLSLSAAFSFKELMSYLLQF
jgi:hypothetical protein